MKRKERENDIEQNPPKKRKKTLDRDHIGTIIRLYTSDEAQSEARKLVNGVDGAFLFGNTCKCQISVDSHTYSVEIRFTTKWNVCETKCNCAHNDLLYCCHVTCALLVLKDYPSKLVDVESFKSRILEYCEKEGGEKLGYVLFKLLEDQNPNQLLLVKEQLKLLEQAPKEVKLQDMMDIADDDIDDSELLDFLPVASVNPNSKLNIDFAVNKLLSIFADFVEGEYIEDSCDGCDCDCHYDRYHHYGDDCDYCKTVEFTLRHFSPIVDYCREMLDFVLAMCKEKEFHNACEMFDKVFTSFFSEMGNLNEDDIEEKPYCERDIDDMPDDMEDVESYTHDICTHIKKVLTEIVISLAAPKDALEKFKNSISTWILFNNDQDSECKKENEKDQKSTPKPLYITVLEDCVKFIDLSTSETNDNVVTNVSEEIVKLKYLFILRKEDINTKQKAKEIHDLSVRVGFPFFEFICKLVLGDEIEKMLEFDNFKKMKVKEAEVSLMLLVYSIHTKNLEQTFVFLTELINKMKNMESNLSNRGNLRNALPKNLSYRSYLVWFNKKLYPIIRSIKIDSGNVQTKKIIELGIKFLQTTIRQQPKEVIKENVVHRWRHQQQPKPKPRQPSQFPSFLLFFLFETKMGTTEILQRVTQILAMHKNNILLEIVVDQLLRRENVSKDVMFILISAVMKNRVEEFVNVQKDVNGLEKVFTQIAELKSEQLELLFIFKMMSVFGENFKTAKERSFSGFGDKKLKSAEKSAEFLLRNNTNSITTFLKEFAKFTSLNSKLLFIQWLLELTYFVDTSKFRTNRRYHYGGGFGGRFGWVQNNETPQESDEIKKFRELKNALLAKLFELSRGNDAFCNRIVSFVFSMESYGEKNSTCFDVVSKYILENSDKISGDVKIKLLRSSEELLKKFVINSQEKLSEAINISERMFKLAKNMANMEFQKKFDLWFVSLNPTRIRLAEFKTKYDPQSFTQLLNVMYQMDIKYITTFPIKLNVEQVENRILCYLAENRSKAVLDIIAKKKYDLYPIVRGIWSHGVSDYDFQRLYLPKIKSLFTVEELCKGIGPYASICLSTAKSHANSLRYKWTNSTDSRITSFLKQMKTIFENAGISKTEFQRYMNTWRTECNKYQYRCGSRTLDAMIKEYKPKVLPRRTAPVLRNQRQVPVRNQAPLTVPQPAKKKTPKIIIIDD